MKNTLMMAGIAAAIAVAPMSLASANVKYVNGSATVTVKCGPAFKPHHRVKVMVLPSRHSSVIMFKNVRCGTTKTINF